MAVIEAALSTLANTGISPTSDLTLNSDSDVSGAGDIILQTGGVERARITAAGKSSLASAHYDPRLQWFGNSLKRMLVSADQSFGLAWLTDSTGNDKPSGANTGDWPYELGALIAAAYPAYTVRWRVWDDTSQDYLATTTIQTGTGGVARSVRFPGTGFGYQLPSTVVSTPPTDLDISMLVSLDNWTPATNQTPVGHDGGAGLRGWWLTVATTGRLQITWSNDGTALNTVASSVAPTVANGASLWIRGTLQVNDGAGNRVIKFYTSADGATWTQLGTTTTTVGTTTLFSPASIVYNLGSRQGGSAELITGNIFEVRWRSGINGNYILPAYPEQWEPVSSTSPNGAVGAPILDIIAGAMPGQGLSYLSNSTRLPLLLPDFSLKAVFMATSHNESTGNTDSVWLASWASWVTAVKSRCYEAVPVITIENPEFSPSVAQLIRAHTMRRAKLLAWAQQLGYPTLDAWQAFLDTSAGAAHYINASDGVHPRLDVQAGDTYSGAQIWAQDANKALLTGS